MKFREINQNERQILRRLNKGFHINFDEVFKGKKILISERREGLASDLRGQALIAAHSKKTVKVNNREEQVVLYGGDILSKSTIFNMIDRRYFRSGR